MRWSLWCVVLLAGCGVELGPDAGVPVGSSSDSGVALHDSGVTRLDAGTEAPDAATVLVIDAGPVLDAGSLNDAGTSFDAGVCGRCAFGYGSVVNAGIVMNPALTEISGLAASRAHPGVLYAHNDSGGRAVIYVMSTTGADLGELVLDGGTNADWEDIALGPCPSGTCLYLGEIGDNSLVNPGPYAVYRVAEPSLASPAVSLGSVSVPFERFALRYPNDEHFNAETLMVHPVTGDVYVVTKPDPFKKASAYKASAPLSTTSINTLIKLTGLKVPDQLDLQLTAGAIDVCGGAMLIRSYSAMYQFTVEPTAPFDSIFSNPFTRVPAPVFKVQETQGESVTWAAGGGYYTVSEGVSPTIHFVGCK